MIIKDYLSKHQILSIGKIPSLDYFCVETIVDNPIEFIEIIYQTTNLYISEIRWWDRVLISKGSKIGYGGARDPRDIEKYYFAETDISKHFNEDHTTQEIIDYILHIKSIHQSFDLYPSFDVKFY